MFGPVKGVIWGHFRTLRVSSGPLWGLKVATKGSNMSSCGRVATKDALEDQQHTYVQRILMFVENRSRHPKMLEIQFYIDFHMFCCVWR